MVNSILNSDINYPEIKKLDSDDSDYDASLYEANILGVDVIFSKGIETPHTDQECIFLEVNSRPYLKMHEYPRHTKKEDLSPFYERLDALAIEDANLY